MTLEEFKKLDMKTQIEVAELYLSGQYNEPLHIDISIYLSEIFLKSRGKSFSTELIKNFKEVYDK